MNLKRGVQNESVMQLQKVLNMNVTGVYGPKTEAAVREWQAKNNRPVTGVVDRETWDLIMTPKQLITEPAPIITPFTTKIQTLVGHIPTNVLNELPQVIAKFNINSPLRLAHFLSQCAHESGNFMHVVENLNYSADGLLRTFPRYFPNRNIALEYQRNPERIASRVYGNRMGNGSEATREGFLYRGRGYLQLTGKNNYRAFGVTIKEDLVKNPNKVATDYPLLSAAWFFSVNNLNRISDKGSTVKVITELTKRINGGTKGLQDRINKFTKFFNILK